MVIDPGGVHWRHDDPRHARRAPIASSSRSRSGTSRRRELRAGWTRWDAEFLPALVRRLPAFSALSDVEGWAGLYEMTPDHNPVLGEHPALRGFIFANGFSGHGLMMSPATGKDRLRDRPHWDAAARSTSSIFAPDRFERGALVHDAATI